MKEIKYINNYFRKKLYMNQNEDDNIFFKKKDEINYVSENEVKLIITLHQRNDKIYKYYTAS